MPFDMNAGRRRRDNADTTESQIELRRQLERRNQELDAQNRVGDNTPPSQPAEEQPRGMAAEKPCFVTVTIPESIKRIADIKVRYDSKELPAYNQTMKHVGRRWFLRGLLAEGLITQDQFDEATALHSEYGWERDKVSAKRRKS